MASAVFAEQTPVNQLKVPVPIIRAGTVSVDGVIRFEDIEHLDPSMANAVSLLRAGHYQEAVLAFRAIQQKTPLQPLAFRGENEAAFRSHSLNESISRYRNLLSRLRVTLSNGKSLAILHYALGDALLTSKYNSHFIGENPNDLGPESEVQLLEAVHLTPGVAVGMKSTQLLAYLALGAYYDHPSQQKGSQARFIYEQAFRIRPDLYQIRYLHAATWDRPVD